jgi:ABC-2 type transport system ATP-binding protein
LKNVLTTSQLSKKYGSFLALQKLSITIPKGSVYGLLGPNGSGKTTTLGMLLGILNPTSGSFTWFEGETSPPLKQRTGALLETPNFYPYLSARKNLQIVATVKELKNPDYEGVLKTVNLLERQHSKFKTFSLGMKQRLAIASALLCQPEFLVLDEPTNGLDPQGIAEVRDIINDIANRGITVLMASHILVEVEKLCTHVAVLKNGKLLYEGPTNGISTKAEGILQLRANDMTVLEKAIEKYPAKEGYKQEGSNLLVTLQAGTGAAQVNQYLAEQGIFVSHLRLHKTSLEQEFLSLIK